MIDGTEAASGASDRNAFEYAALVERNSAYRQYLEGCDAEEVALEAVAAPVPRRVVEVGCGTGEFALWIAARTAADVVALDVDAKMVDVARTLGIDARVSDARNLPFGDGEFDCAVANWVLHELSDAELAIRELARVLRPGGRLVAATLARSERPSELELLLGEGPPVGRGDSFGSHNGGDLLGRVFQSVDAIDCDFALVFPDHEVLRQYVAAFPGREHLAARVPRFDGSFRLTGRSTVFVADEPLS